jgi:hypothetical protein
MKDLAQKALEHLLLDEAVDGVRFGPIPQMLFTGDAVKTPRIVGQVYINLATRWTVFSSRPNEMPKVESDLVEVSPEKEFQAIYQLREARVRKVELGSGAPHLILTMEDGRVLFINGHDDDYEPWQAGEAFGRPERSVIACPGGEIAMFGVEDLD